MTGAQATGGAFTYRIKCPRCGRRNPRAPDPDEGRYLVSGSAIYHECDCTGPAVTDDVQQLTAEQRKDVRYFFASIGRRGVGSDYQVDAIAHYGDAKAKAERKRLRERIEQLHAREPRTPVGFLLDELRDP